MIYVVDTHALIWYLEGGKKLGSKALHVLSDESCRLIIPAIVLVEAKYLCDRNRVKVAWTVLIETIERSERSTIYPLDLPVIEYIPSALDIHDGIIVATALLYRERMGEAACVVTRDEAITSAGIILTIW